MSARRSAPVLAALLVLGSGLAGCNEDSVYEKNGSPEDTIAPSAVGDDPGLKNVGTAAPIPTRTDDVGIGGEERSGGEPAQ